MSNCTDVPSFLPGMLVYVPDNNHVWSKAVVQDILKSGKCRVTVLQSQENQECKLCDLLPRSEQCVQDIKSLTELSPINEATVLDCLDERFLDKQIYTNAGSTIVAINPFCDTAHLYSVDVAFAYHLEEKEEPHIYRTGCEAYKRMCRGLGHGNQCIIVSGESGSGKTVSAKHLLRYMTLISSCSSDSRPERISLIGQSVEQRILESNPILEAFGNAVTQRNDNSSRFGKFINLLFNRGGQLAGGEIHTYLLEKTRVVHQSPGESNFHIFYQVMQSLLEAGDTHVGNIVQNIGEDGFKILPKGKCISNNRDLKETLEAMSQIGISQESQNDIMKVLVAILFLGNVDFVPFEEDISKLLTDSEDDHLDTTFYELEVTQCAVQQTAELLGLDATNIEQVLLYRSIQSGGSNKRRSIFVKPVPQREAYSRRDCLATLLYSRLFDWLVTFINSQIQTENCDCTIGLLDIYGFEAFEHNSLEQLCINYANEKLQQHYITHFLKDLQKEYEAECIDWQFLSYNDNQPCLDILEGPVSVFGLLNEDVQLNRKEDPRQLCERIADFAKMAPKYVKKPKNYLKSPGFSIRHYAGDVVYSGEGLTTKNKDIVPQELIELLQHSSSEFVSKLFDDYQTDTATGRRRKTVLSKFKMSLDSLMASLQSSDVHYIRCVKPNPGSLPAVFDRPYVMAQLVASGIIETVKISCHGYPFRMKYACFLKRYGLIIRNTPTQRQLDPETATQGDNESLYDPLEELYRKQLDMTSASPRKSQTPRKRLRRRAGLSGVDHLRRCCAALLKIQFGDCQKLPRQFGRTKLFLHQYQVDNLETRRLEILGEKASVIQRYWRDYKELCERRRRRLRETSAGIIQTAWRKYWCAQKHSAVVMLQKSIRMHLARNTFKKLQASQAQKQDNGRKRSWKMIIDRKNVSDESQKSKSSSRSGRKSRSENSFGSDMSDTSAVSDYSIGKENRLETGEEKVTSFQLESPLPTRYDSSISGSLESCCQAAGEGQSSTRSRKRMVKGRPNLANLGKIMNSGGDTSAQGMVSGVGDEKMAVSPVKKRRTERGSVTTLEDLAVGNGIITRRRLPKVPIRFHTKPSILKNAHLVNKKELSCGLEDCLIDEQSHCQTTSQTDTAGNS